MAPPQRYVKSVTSSETQVRTLERTIRLPSAVALYCGAVLGSGILVLPAVAAETAGPASVVAWAALCLLSFPLALTFAALARRQAVAGGFSAYIARGLGRRWGAIAGWIFLAQVPTGTVIAGLIAGSYIGAPLGLGRTGVFLIAASIIVLAYGLNLLGLRFAGAVQSAATAGVLLLVGIIVIAAARDVHAVAFHPFAPAGWPAVGVAATQLFWAFVGWEAITPLAEEFAHPERDLARASIISVVVVAIVYLVLAVVTVGTHAYGAAAGALPSFAAMAAHVLGGRAVVAVGVVGGVLAFTPLNAYVAGTSRLAYALACSGDLPSWAARLHPTTRVPHRVLAVLGGACLAALVVAYAADLGIARLLPISTSSFLATYVLSMAAAVRLLDGRAAWLAAISLVACVTVLAFVGALVVWLLAVSAAALVYSSWRARADIATAGSKAR